MFDYTKRLQLAVGDSARRTAMKIIAGLVLAVSAGFLLAALWTWLATGLGFGAMYASLAIGGAFLLVALVLLAVASKPKHDMPTTDDLKREVEARLSLAADAATDRALHEAERVMDMAGNKVSLLMNEASFRADKLASDAERRVQGMARDTARKVGLSSENIAAAKQAFGHASGNARTAADSNAGSMAKLLGAFAIGITLAAKLQEHRRRDSFDDLDGDDLL